ncbi:MAG: hypothetical protein AB9860_03385 [Methanomassiliicoccales archaeon]
MDITSDEIVKKIRLMKVMYLLTIVIAGGIGLMILIAPDQVMDAMGFPEPEPIMVGIAASVYLAFGLLSVLGLKAPLKFCPVLLLQLTYKSVWFIAVILPLLVTGDLPDYAWMTIGIFAVFVIGDLIALPFRYLLNGTEVRD